MSETDSDSVNESVRDGVSECERRVIGRVNVTEKVRLKRDVGRVYVIKKTEGFFF